MGKLHEGQITDLSIGYDSEAKAVGEGIRHPSLNRIFVIFGADGAGKTTIGNEFAREINSPVYDFGKEIRKLADDLSNTSQEAIIAREVLGGFRVLQTDTLNSIIVPRISGDDTKSGAVLIGA